jgi:hypothetical protein
MNREMKMMMNQTPLISRLPMMIVLVVAFSLPYPIIPDARANPTGMQAPSTGGLPYVSITGTHNGGNNDPVVIYTVPNNRVFILTGLIGYTANDSVYYDIYENMTLKVLGVLIPSPRAHDSHKLCSFLCSNQAVVPFSSGSEIKLQPTNGTGSMSHRYMIQGYLANPG